MPPLPPIVDRYLNEHLFCDIFERDLLTWQERELAAVAILTPWAKAPLPMLRSHSAICLRQGLTEGQLRQMTEIVNGLKEDAALPFCTRHADARQSELHGGGARRGCKAMSARRMVSTARGGGRDFRSRVP